MGRGSQSQTQQLTDQQLASINALNQNLFGQQQSLGNQLLPQFQNIANNPGLSPADKAAVTAQSQGSLASAFDSLQQSAANRAARTGNCERNAARDGASAFGSSGSSSSEGQSVPHGRRRICSRLRPSSSSAA